MLMNPAEISAYNEVVSLVIALYLAFQVKLASITSLSLLSPSLGGGTTLRLAR